MKERISHSQKRSTKAMERDECLRRAWHPVIGGPDTRNLMFVDGMSTHTSPAPLYGSSPREQRAFFNLLRNRGTITAMLSSMSLEEIRPSIVSRVLRPRKA
jgi:hypothetical protein